MEFLKCSEHKPHEVSDGCSDWVLVDIDGWRKEFVIAYYDHDDKKWRVQGGDQSPEIEEGARWSYLPLGKYDKKS